MGHMLTPRFGAMQGTTEKAEYYEQMRTFLAVPGVSTQDRLKIRPPKDADTVEIRYKTSVWTSDDDKSVGALIGIINEYKASTSYAIDDWVICDGECYICIQAGTGQQPDTSPLYWTNASDINNNIWYDVTGLTNGVRYFYKAFPAKSSAYNEINYLPVSAAHEYELDGNSADRIGNADGSESNVTYVPREYNYAGLFNGSSSYVTLPSAAVPSANTDYSFDIWFNQNVLDSGMIISWISTTLGVQRQLSQGATRGIDYYWRGQDGANHHIDSTSDIITNQWYHVVVTHEHGVSTKLYVNGVLKNTDTYTGDESAAFNLGLFIGAQSAAVSNFSGEIDNVRIYNTNLTSTEISDLYNANADFYAGNTNKYVEPASLPSNLVHYYKLDQNANDSKGSNNGTASNVTYESAITTKAGVFNGSSSYVDLGSPSTFDRSVKTAGNGCAYECWFNFSSWSYYPRILEDNNGWDFYIIGGDSAANIIASLGGTGSVTSPTLSLDTWYHCIVNIKSDYTLEFYLDGNLVGTKSNVSTPTSLSSNIVLGNATDQSRFMNGKLDNIRLYDHSLNPTEIKNLYHANADFYKGETDLYTEPESLPTSLVHYYKLNGNALDSKGSNDGTASNLTYDTFDYAPLECAEFDGTSSYIDLGSPSDFDRSVKTAGNGCSYECWFKVTEGLTTTNFILNDYNGWYMNLIHDPANNRIWLTKYNTSTNWYHAFSANGSIIPGNWYHAVANYLPDYSLELFLDGVKVDFNTDTSLPYDFNLKIGVGGRSFDGDTPFKGKIDNVRFYDHSLTQDEISILYSEFENVHPNESQAVGGGLNAEYTYDNISGSTLFDTSGNGNNATNSNVSIESGIIGNEGKYNGSTSYTNIPGLNASELDSNFSISLWITPRNGGSFRTVVCYYKYREVTIDLFYTTLEFRFNKVNPDPKVSYGLTAGVRYHVVFTRNTSAGLKMYVDGELVATTSTLGNAYSLSQANSRIGSDNGTRQALCEVDQFREYTRELTPTEITALYNKGRGC